MLSHRTFAMQPTGPSSLLVLGSALALIGWAHLTSPRGPDFRQTLVKLATQISHGSLSDARLRERRVSRLRRELAAKGFRLVISKRRKLPPGMGGFLVMEFATRKVPIGGDPVPFSATLEAVEAWVTCLRDEPRPEHVESGSEALAPGQCRTARQLLGWSRFRLGARAYVTAGMIAKFEAGGPIPPQANVSLRAALEAAGLEFIAENGGGAGVRLRWEHP